MPKQKVKKTILIDKDEFDKFRERHPGHGDFVWFVREALKKYNELNEVDPNELVELAVGEIDLR